MGVTTEPSATSVARWRQAGIPRRFQSQMGNDQFLSECLSSARPENFVREWASKFRSGDILMSDTPRSCGLGLWLRGDFEADFVGAALLQSLLLEGYVESGLYLHVDDLLESETPDGESLADKRWVDLLLLRGVGEHYNTVTNWANTTISGLLRRRFDRGLPTIITTPKAPEDAGVPAGFARQAFLSVLFDG